MTTFFRPSFQVRFRTLHITPILIPTAVLSLKQIMRIGTPIQIPIRGLNIHFQFLKSPVSFENLDIMYSVGLNFAHITRW